MKRAPKRWRTRAKPTGARGARGPVVPERPANAPRAAGEAATAGGAARRARQRPPAGARGAAAASGQHAVARAVAHQSPNAAGGRRRRSRRPSARRRTVARARCRRTERALADRDDRGVVRGRGDRQGSPVRGRMHVQRRRRADRAPTSPAALARAALAATRAVWSLALRMPCGLTAIPKYTPGATPSLRTASRSVELDPRSRISAPRRASADRQLRRRRDPDQCVLGQPVLLALVPATESEAGVPGSVVRACVQYANRTRRSHRRTERSLVAVARAQRSA